MFINIRNEFGGFCNLCILYLDAAPNQIENEKVTFTDCKCFHFVRTNHDSILWAIIVQHAVEGCLSAYP